MFRELEHESVTLVSGGVYKVADLYERDGLLFAAGFGGYVRLRADGTTSKDKVRWQWPSLDTTKMCTTRTGVLALVGRRDTTPLQLVDAQRVNG